MEAWRLGVGSLLLFPHFKSGKIYRIPFNALHCQLNFHRGTTASKWPWLEMTRQSLLCVCVCGSVPDETVEDGEEIRGVGFWGGTAGNKEEHMVLRQPDGSQQQIAPHVSHLFIFLFYFLCTAAESEAAAAPGWKDHKTWRQNLNIRIIVFIMVVWVSDLIILFIHNF